jgi:hypothetical protein
VEANSRAPKPIGRPHVLSSPRLVVAGVLAAVALTFVFIITRSSDPGVGSRTPTAPSVSVSTQTNVPTTNRDTATTVAEPSDIAPSLDVGAGGDVSDPVRFVQGYFEQLPDNTDAAWKLLGPTAQSQSGGRAGFDAFYAGLARVWPENLRISGNAVTATIVFTDKSGRVVREPYTFVVGTQDGRQVIESFSRG